MERSGQVEGHRPGSENPDNHADQEGVILARVVEVIEGGGLDVNGEVLSLLGHIRPIPRTVPTQRGRAVRAILFGGDGLSGDFLGGRLHRLRKHTQASRTVFSRAATIGLATHGVG